MFGSTANNNAAFEASPFDKKAFGGDGGNNNNNATASSAGGSGTGFGFVKMNPMPSIAPKGSNTNIITIGDKNTTTTTMFVHLCTLPIIVLSEIIINNCHFHLPISHCSKRQFFYPKAKNLF